MKTQKQLWEEIFHAMAQGREAMAVEKARQEASRMAKAGKVCLAYPQPPLPPERPRERPVSFSDDSKDRWDYLNNPYRNDHD